MTTSIKVFVNEKFYKDVVVNSTNENGKISYDPNEAVRQVLADKEAGLLVNYIKSDGKMVLRMEKN